jgi:hypothetical protein
LERTLRHKRGYAFQTFFADVMQVRHGEKFVRSVALGRAGGMKCDGMMLGPRIAHACYGLMGGGAYVEGTVENAAKKVASTSAG